MKMRGWKKREKEGGKKEGGGIGIMVPPDLWLSAQGPGISSPVTQRKSGRIVVPERHGPEPQFYQIGDDGADQMESGDLGF